MICRELLNQSFNQSISQSKRKTPGSVNNHDKTDNPYIVVTKKIQDNFACLSSLSYYFPERISTEMILLFTENSSSAQFFIKNKENKFLALINTSSPRIHVVFSPVALIRASSVKKQGKSIFTILEIMTFI